VAPEGAAVRAVNGHYTFAQEGIAEGAVTGVRVFRAAGSPAGTAAQAPGVAPGAAAVGDTAAPAVGGGQAGVSATLSELRALTPDQQVARLSSLSYAERGRVLSQLSGPERQAYVAAAERAQISAGLNAGLNESQILGRDALAAPGAAPGAAGQLSAGLTPAERAALFEPGANLTRTQLVQKADLLIAQRQAQLAQSGAAPSGSLAPPPGFSPSGSTVITGAGVTGGALSLGASDAAAATPPVDPFVNLDILSDPQYLAGPFDVGPGRDRDVQWMIMETAPIFSDGFESGDTSAWSTEQARRAAPRPLDRWPLMGVGWADRTAVPVRLVSSNVRPGGMGQAPALEPGGEPALEILITALGGSTGDVLEVQVANVGRVPVRLSGDGLVVEPLQAVGRRQVEQAAARLAARRPRTAALASYCLEFLRQPPSAGTVFRVADQEVQRQFAPMRRILGASRRLFEAGLLSPDSDPTAYFHSIRQWAMWAAGQGLTGETYADAFVAHTAKNVRAAGQPWTEDVEDAVRGLAPARWADITRILDEARGN
jgi:hypothetical protein